MPLICDALLKAVYLLVTVCTVLTEGKAINGIQF